MRRNCHLELRLVPPQSPFIFSDHQHHQEEYSSCEEVNTVGGDLKEKQNQQMTIIYDGKVSVCNVTELQAMRIIRVASEEMSDKWGRTPCSPLTSPLICSQGGLCMRRSLQRFLQKRKHRIQSTSPYNT